MDLIDITDRIVDELKERIWRGEFRSVRELRIALREAADAYGKDSRLGDWIDWLMYELQSSYSLYCETEEIVMNWY